MERLNLNVQSFYTLNKRFYTCTTDVLFLFCVENLADPAAWIWPCWEMVDTISPLSRAWEQKFRHIIKK